MFQTHTDTHKKLLKNTHNTQKTSEDIKIQLKYNLKK